MNSLPNLDDTTETVFCIPFVEPEGEVNTHDESSGKLDEDDLRMLAYKEAWAKCLNRVKEIINSLYKPAVELVLNSVRESSEHTVPGLPYPELPIICITNPSSGSTFLDEVTKRMAQSPDDLDPLFDSLAFVTHISPGDCLNVMNGMKTIINGFIDGTAVKMKHKISNSLATYDVHRLIAWYHAIREHYDIELDSEPKLILVLHDFEQFDPRIMEIIFHICSQHVRELPFIFLISLSCPPSPSYLHANFSKATISLFQINSLVAPAGAEILEQLLKQLFFDPHFEPDIILGPAGFRSLTEHFTRHNSSVDSLITHLQLVHLKHFTQHPFSLLALDSPAALPPDFLSSLKHRCSTHNLIADDGAKQSTIVNVVNTAREDFRRKARRLRLGHAIVRIVQEFMTGEGYKSLDWDRNPTRGGAVGVMVAAMTGGLTRDVKFLATMIRKLRQAQLVALMRSIARHLDDLGVPWHEQEQKARKDLQIILSTLDSDSGDDEFDGQIPVRISDWFIDYTSDLLTPLTEAVLWDVWYTGMTPFPSELINPSVRATIVAGLLRPLDFTRTWDDVDDQEGEADLTNLPDISILFRRYLDSGKMINIYDWFESFKVVLESQREQATSRKGKGRASRNSSPRKNKGKQPANNVIQDEQKWGLQVQARFMRAFHELDYLGFIKHTGRRPDHVLRTVFDVADSTM